MIGKLTGEGEDEVKKSIAIFRYKQRILSIEMKTKVVQHVPGYCSEENFLISNLNFYSFKT